MARQELERSTKLRMVVGFAAVAPSLAVLSFFVFMVLEAAGTLPSSGRLTNPAGAAAGVAIAIGIVAFVVTVGGAVPLVLSRSERGPLDRPWLLAIGAALGNVPLALIIAGATVVNFAAGTLERGRDLYDIGPSVIRVMIGTAAGWSGAAIFWFVGVRDTELDPEHVPMSQGRSLLLRD